MKVLFISRAELPDFQCDMVFHGLRSLLGADCVDSNPMWYMYSDTMNLYWNTRVPNNGKSYGNGFTLYGLLENIDIDRSNIAEKIKNKYYDKIVYGSITRCDHYFNIVLENYEKSDIIIIDGEDNTTIDSRYYDKGIYHKRELIYEISEILQPINFCIPKELIVDKMPNKVKDYAHIIPGDLSTYIYDNQQAYYEDYQQSYYGVTFKKGGWDCLRHYEILMNGCIPFFPGLDECPSNTMTLFPKTMIMENNRNLINNGLSATYEDETNSIIEHTRNYLTTEYTAKKLIYGNI
jgi:small nuclear ribonucleoprotein (snRNP)-like protein